MFPGQFPTVPPAMPGVPLPSVPLPGVVPSPFGAPPRMMGAPVIPAPYAMGTSMVAPPPPAMVAVPNPNRVSSSNIFNSGTPNNRTNHASISNASRRQLYSGPPRPATQSSTLGMQTLNSSMNGLIRPPPGIVPTNKDNSTIVVESPMKHTRLYVGQLNEHMTDTLMFSIFECCGEVQDWTRLKDSFGFVTFKEPRAAGFCQDILDQKDVFGYTIQVKASGKMKSAIEAAKEARKSEEKEKETAEPSDESTKEVGEVEETDLDKQLLKMSEIDAIITKFKRDNPHVILADSNSSSPPNYHPRSSGGRSRSPHRAHDHYHSRDRNVGRHDRGFSRSRSRGRHRSPNNMTNDEHSSHRESYDHRDSSLDSPTHRSREMKLAFQVDAPAPPAITSVPTLPSASSSSAVPSQTSQTGDDIIIVSDPTAMDGQSVSSCHSAVSASSVIESTLSDPKTIMNDDSVDDKSGGINTDDNVHTVDDVFETDEVSERVRELRQSKIKSTQDIVAIIPSGEDELFDFPIDWQTIEKAQIIDNMMAKWCDTRFQEYLNESDSEFCQFTVGLLHQRANPRQICVQLKMVLQKDTNSFVCKLWRRMIFEMIRAMHNL